MKFNKELTVAKAVKMEKSLFTLGKAYKHAQHELRSAIRNFRTSGAWAITPQRHRTFSKWCFYAATIMGMSPYSLQSYACPNYQTHLEKAAKESEDNILFTGQAARLMRRAIKLACSINGKKTSKRRTKWGGIIVASFYIERHSQLKLKKAA